MEEHDARPPRKKLTKAPNDENGNKRSGPSSEPAIPERTSSHSGHGPERRSSRRKRQINSTSNVADEATVAGEPATAADAEPRPDDKRENQEGNQDENADDGEDTEYEEAPQDLGPEPRNEKGKRQSRRKRNKGSQEAQSAREETDKQGERKDKEPESGAGPAQAEDPHTFPLPHLEEEIGEDGCGDDYQEAEEEEEDDDNDNVINLNNFPANPGPRGAAAAAAAGAPPAWQQQLQQLLSPQPQPQAPPPRAPRDDYVRAIANDRHTLQQTVQQLVATLQREQYRRMRAEESVAALEDGQAALRDLVAKHREEAERHKKGHTQVLRDLNRFKAGQGFSQMSDDFLTQKAQELRQDIRDFAIQYFLGDLDEIPQKVDGTKLGDFMTGLSPLDPHQSFLLSPTRAASAVEAFLWVVLAKAVFGGWYWAGGGRFLLHDVFAWMRPEDYSFALLGADNRDAADPEAERRFYTWRATTAKLVSERPGIMVRDNLRNKLVEEICATVSPYLRGVDADDSGHVDDLRNIVNKAIEFDKETSQQASRLEWVFCRAPGQKDKGEPQRYDPGVMELQMFETPPGDGAEVLLVVAPALRKRGRSNGEDYSVETLLLKMEVTCEPVTDMVVSS